jgi:hypothetical protein
LQKFTKKPPAALQVFGQNKPNCVVAPPINNLTIASSSRDGAESAVFIDPATTRRVTAFAGMTPRRLCHARGSGHPFLFMLSKWIPFYKGMTDTANFVILREVAESAFVVLRDRPCN